LGSLDGQHGWRANSANARVQSDFSWELNQSTSVESAEVYQLLAGDATNAWIIFSWKPAPSLFVKVSDIPKGASSVFWVNEFGILMGYSNQIPVEISGAYVDTNQWVRTVVHEDYETSQWSMWLDGNQVINQFGFYTNRVGSTIKLSIKNNSTLPVYIDDLHVTATAWNPQPGDTDNDGLADAWELNYFQSPNILTNSSGDYDHDGLADGGEEIAGTNPTDNQSLFEITDAQREGGADWIIRWSSVSGHLYTIDACTNLLDDSWTNIVSDISATPPENVYTAQVSSVESQFSRILVREQ
jgi:hypothetical protein